MNLNLNQKVIIVAKGATEIGEKVCENLTKEEAIVCILDNDEKNMSKVVSKIKKQFGTEVFAVFTEFDKASYESAINKILIRFKRIDGFINNAGMDEGVSIENGNYEEIFSSIDRNIGQYFGISDQIFSGLKKSFGSIVNVYSKNVFKADLSNYITEKGISFPFITEWASQLKTFDINVNDVVILDNLMGDYERHTREHTKPFIKLNDQSFSKPLANRKTKVDAIADLAVLLVSPISKCVNGQVFFMDDLNISPVKID